MNCDPLEILCKFEKYFLGKVKRQQPKRQARPPPGVAYGYVIITLKSCDDANIST